MRVSKDVAEAKEGFVRGYLAKHPKATAAEVRAALIKSFSSLPKAARGMKPQQIGVMRRAMGATVARGRRPYDVQVAAEAEAPYGKATGVPCVLPFRKKEDTRILRDLLERLRDSGLADLKVDHVGDGYVVVVKR